MGLNIGSTPASGLYVGSAPAQGMYVGSQLVYPPQMMGYSSFNYGQTGTVDLASVSGGEWTQSNDSVGIKVTTAGVITTSSTTTDRTYLPLAQWAQPMNKYEIEVAGYLAEALTGEAVYLFAGKPLTAANFIALSMSSTAVKLMVCNQRLTQVSAIDITSSVSPQPGLWVQLRRSRIAGSSNIKAEVLVDGVSKFSTQLSGLPAPGLADQNVGGVCLAFRRASWTNYYAAKLDAFDIETF